MYCSRLPRDYGSILYCTTGIMLQRMQSNPLLNDVSVLILDEIHERSVETDLLMALLKKVLKIIPYIAILFRFESIYVDHLCLNGQKLA